MSPLRRSRGRASAARSRLAASASRGRPRSRLERRPVDGGDDPARQRRLAQPHVVEVQEPVAGRAGGPPAPRAPATRAAARRARGPASSASPGIAAARGAAWRSRGLGLGASRPATGSPDADERRLPRRSCSRCPSPPPASRASTSRQRWTASRGTRGVGCNRPDRGSGAARVLVCRRWSQPSRALGPRLGCQRRRRRRRRPGGRLRRVSRS